MDIPIHVLQGDSKGQKMRVELETKTLINHSLDIHKTLLHYKVSS
jgi:hypothetical protein